MKLQLLGPKGVGHIAIYSRVSYPMVHPVYCGIFWNIQIIQHVLTFSFVNLLDLAQVSFGYMAVNVESTKFV